MDAYTHKIRSFSALALVVILISPLSAFTGNAQEREKLNRQYFLSEVQHSINRSEVDNDYISNQKPLFRPYLDIDNISKTDTIITTDTWSDLFELIEEDPNFPNKEQTLTILEETPISERMSMLKKLNYNDEYDYMVNVTFTQLRNGAVYKSDNNHQAEVLSEILIDENLNSNQQFVEKPLFALKTNLLYDAATIINASLEVPIGNHWSIAGEFIFPWWLDQKKQNCIQIYNGNLEAKYWFSPRENQKKGKFSTMTGWFMGAYYGAGLYDIEYNGKGYQGESLLSVGLTGGYAHSIGKCLRMEYSIGFGYMQTDYRYYEAKFSTIDNEWGLYRKYSGNTKWIGPTHAKISLVWMLSHNVKKGGVR